MAVFQRIREFFIPAEVEPEAVIPAPMTVYSIRPLTEKNLKEVLRLNLRCFKAGENYTKYTFSYLLTEPNTLSYRMVTPADQMVGFIFIMVNENGVGHITTIGVAPEHRRRGLALELLGHAENAVRQRDVSMMSLEVRVSNIAAQTLYNSCGYSIVQRLKEYYNNGEDGFLMVKPL
ncbi:MAG: ribosomal protein S18-alanine N-acetyltransferase [Pyrinomonadaceae bacterium]